MAERGRVVIHTEHNKPFEIREYDVPDPEPGAIIVRITQAGVCGSDRGDSIMRRHAPRIFKVGQLR